MTKTFVCAVAFGLFAALPLVRPAYAASAAYAEPVRFETVRFDDLNLASAEGIATLRQRLDAAAQRVCDEKLGLKTDVFATRRARACEALAVKRAQAIVAAARPEAVQLASR